MADVVFFEKGNSVVEGPLSAFLSLDFLHWGIQGLGTGV